MRQRVHTACPGSVDGSCLCHSSLQAPPVFCSLDKYLLSTCVVGAGATQTPTQEGRTGALSHRHPAHSWQPLLGRFTSAEDSCLAWMTFPSQSDPCQRTDRHRDINKVWASPPTSGWLCGVPWGSCCDHITSQLPPWPNLLPSLPPEV